VNDWSGLFLAIIAVATLAMALIQIGAIIAVLRLAREAQAVIASVQRDVKPLLVRANDIVEEASKTVSLATVQAEKVDKLMTDLTRRVDETSVLVQQAIVRPAREGMAIVSAVKAALGVFRGLGDFRGRQGRGGEEDDPLFIG
jgi:hypothetical protein